ncbi:hypothetical protein NAH08_11055, partial [Francisella tularensis subsp. holarctica]|nr:hypothetical protein [Francisella tularensis subsp. holarctica]
MKVKKLVKSIFIASCSMISLSTIPSISYAEVSDITEVNKQVLNQNSTIITGKILPNDSYVIRDSNGNTILEGVSDSNG